MIQSEFKGLIKNNEPYFFLHVPKTAGTTFTTILGQLFQDKDICPAYYTFELLELNKAELNKYRLFQGHIYYNVLQGIVNKPLQTLTFVRNPIDHAVSQLQELKRMDKLKNLKERAIYNRQIEDAIIGWKDNNYSEMSLQEFVDNDVNYQNQQVKRFVENDRYLHFDVHKDPPSSVVLTSVNEDDLEVAKKMVANCFFLGVTERFEESLMLFSYLLGIRPVRVIPRLNVSNNRPSRDEISPEIRRKITANSALDVQLYEFACQLFDERFSKMCQELLDRYASTGPGAGADIGGVNTSLSKGNLYALLDKRYQANFKELNPPITSLSFTLDQPLSGEGWYSRENNSDYGYIRWSGPDLSASLDLPLAAQSDFLINVEILNALKKELVEGLVLEVNGVQIPLAFSYNGVKTLTYKGVIKTEVLQKNPGLATITFKVNEVIDLGVINPGGEDNRKLGIALKKIDIVPV